MKEIKLKEKLCGFAAALRTIACDLGDRIINTPVLRQGLIALLLLLFSYACLSTFADYSEMKGTVVDPELNYRKLDRSLYSYEYLDIKVTKIQGFKYMVLEMTNSSPEYEAEFSVGALSINGCKLDICFEEKLSPGETVKKRIDISKALEYGVPNVEKIECYVCFTPTYSIDIEKLDLTAPEKKATLENRRRSEKCACSLILFKNYQPVPMLDMTQVYSDAYITLWTLSEPEPEDEDKIPEYEGLTIIYRNNCSYTALVSMIELNINEEKVMDGLETEDMLCTPGNYGMIRLPYDAADSLSLEQLQNAERLSVKFRIMNYSLEEDMFENRQETAKPVYLIGEAPIIKNASDSSTEEAEEQNN